MSEKSERAIWEVVHVYDHRTWDEYDGKDWIEEISEPTGYIYATPEEAEAYKAKWNKPEPIDRYEHLGTLYAHRVELYPITVHMPTDFPPYSIDPDDYFNSEIKRLKGKEKEE